MTGKTAPRTDPPNLGATGQFMALGASFGVGAATDRATDGSRELGLREHEYLRMLKTLLANIHGIVYRCRDDAQHTLEFASQGCLAITGYDVAQLLHNNAVEFASLKHPDDQLWVSEAMRAGAEGAARLRSGIPAGARRRQRALGVGSRHGRV